MTRASSSRAQQRKRNQANRTTSPRQGESATLRQPRKLREWKQRCSQLSAQGDLENALAAADQARALAPDDAEAAALQGKVSHLLGRPEAALELLHQAIAIAPDYAKAQHYIGYIYYTQARYDQALPFAERACELIPGDVDMLNTLGNILLYRHDYERAREVLEKAAALAPEKYLSWNNLGNIHNALGDLDAGLESYRRAHEASPTAPGPFSNLITSYHYHPQRSAEEISALCKSWHDRFPPTLPPPVFDRQQPENKRLRIGLISDGFRGHPVGRMITSVLEQVSANEMALYFYSTNNASDGITQRLKRVATQWMSMQAMRDEQVVEQVRGDGIDILIDLAGHNAGNRAMAVSSRLAPLQLKWVGGLINTTGIRAMDYLLSDSVETPAGVDDAYVEKLIRMPDDYICYVPPNGYEPDVGPLPALENGYITLGCFNNAIKINDMVLEQWAAIMHDLPDSRLYLKSMQYKSAQRVRIVVDRMAALGIEEQRLIIEGPSPHEELLDAYNRVDIALDPWPYSGGLTTCEAFLMGVPVVSLPGPTFAGRHSASHLVNAGMPELVVNSWEEYRQRVLELAGDPDSLARIRRYLRSVLLESPVTDASRFATHFTRALRAIWVRHCRGHTPAALAFDQQGRPCFADDDGPIDLPQAAGDGAAAFSWSLPGPVVVVDNGARLFRDAGFDEMRKQGTFVAVGFDPAGSVEDTRYQDATDSDVQLFRHATLGDGSQGTLYATLDPGFSATLAPLPQDAAGADPANGRRILAEMPIASLQLDQIEGLQQIDWLILDQYSDSATILTHGQEALANALLLQVRVVFKPTHQRQTELGAVLAWALENGFRLYRLNDLAHGSRLPRPAAQGSSQHSELLSGDALLIPDDHRLAAMPAERRSKLAYLLHTVFSIHDLSWELLHGIDRDLAQRYLDSLTAPLTRSTANEASHPAAGMPKIPDAPHMSAAEAEMFKRSLESAGRYFEFGSGGSTVWAAAKGLQVEGVESDAKWVAALRQRIGEQCRVKSVDIGPTREWGFPVSAGSRERFPDYSRAIAAHDTGFDMILIDGRFRVACTLATIAHCLDHQVSKEARLFIHDFWDRPVYHCVLDFLETVERCDTAGVFRIRENISRDVLAQRWQEYAYNPQ
ncbi:tetratricopeptide repeat protein [Parahaliea aestuarii]|uniref:protein O-GlcNAc transferase n=1 Tax=Parahaliea aestuarii TaxID=1852021 RepID=A0A5C9A4A6_9GAMM|nr:tetratricopeptide repeat protein [Parahaliea aestuarii]TXS94792.1 tetratricopeptide repeat protein [Parahaliea aestuarii]